MQPPKPRILLLTITLGKGGAEKHLVRIANGLRERFEVHIAVIRTGGSYEAELLEGIYVHHVGSKWVSRVSTLLAGRHAVAALARLIDTIAPECVISFLPLVSHACFLARKHCAHTFKHAIAIQCNLDPVLAELDGWFRRPFRRGVCESILDADGVITISKGVGKNLRERFPSLRAMTTTIYNAAIDGTPPDEAGQQPQSSRAATPFQLVSCGRLAEQKGFFDLLKAFRIVRDHGEANLKILGTGPLQSALGAEVARLGLQADVEFLGFQSRPLDYFRDADLFVLSSLWEGFGNVLVEAMSVGTPVISTDCPFGPSEIIEHGASGILVPVGAPEEMAEQIIALMKDPGRRDVLAAAGKERSQAFHTRVIAEQYAAYIEALTKSSEAPP
jgi:glycosyltransferase involved in cell wall biosynthesis